MEDNTKNRRDETQRPEWDINSLTDAGNAARFAERYGDSLCFVPGRDWMRYKGGRWIAADDPLLLGRAISLTRSMSEEAIDLMDHSKYGYATESQHLARLRAMLKLAPAYLRVPPERLDQDLWSLNVANGTIDLQNGDLRPHNREDYITRIAPVEYDPAASCPTFESFLKQIFAGDAELIRFVQQAVGATLIGEAHVQGLFIPYGTGANGKTTLLELLHDMLGDYARKAPIDLLMKTSTSDNLVHLAQLPGVRMVSADESDIDRKMAEGAVKSMTGSDTLVAKFLYKDPFEFVPQFNLWLDTNHLPRVSGTDHGIWRRLKVIPFDVTIPQEDQDPTLGSKLRDELPGILAWAVRGTLDYLENGLIEPAAVTRAVSEYRQAEDPVGDWIEDCCDVGDDLWESTGDLHTSYVRWASANGEREVTKRALGARLRERGLVDDRRVINGSQQRGWRGISVRTHQPPSDDDPFGRRPAATTQITHPSDSDSDMDTVDRFAEWREQAGITLGQAAREVGCGGSHLGRVLRRQRNPSAELLDRMATLMNEEEPQR